MLSPKMKLLLSIILIMVVLTLVFELADLSFPVGGYSLYIVIFVIAVLFYALLSKLMDKLKKKRLWCPRFGFASSPGTWEWAERLTSFLSARYKLIYEKKHCQVKDDFEMGEKVKTTDNRNMHAIILSVLGIILVIVGTAIITIPGAPMRGSGIGTLSVLAGIVLLVIAFLRFYYKRPQWVFFNRLSHFPLFLVLGLGVRFYLSLTTTTWAWQSQFRLVSGWDKER
jgi:hypothetical protein